MNIILNVQGQIFETDYNTILKIPYFKDMFESCGKPDEIIFVNRPSHVFKHVLGLATDDLYPYPSKYTFELDFYGIEYKGFKVRGDVMYRNNDLHKKDIQGKQPGSCVREGCQELPVNDKYYQMELCKKHMNLSGHCGVYGCHGPKLLLDSYCNTHWKKS
jgi:hypothetical protein